MSSSPWVDRPAVVAAGAVVLRRTDGTTGGHEVLLVHRPRYDDWSFPKGKLDDGEHLTSCAVREVQEETGLRITLGLPLRQQRYLLANGRDKIVHYWIGRVLGDETATSVPNDEVDELRWVGWDEARQLLSYDYDRETLEQARALRRRTRTVVVVRHAKAVGRGDFSGSGEPDERRPLSDEGRAQARHLVPLLQAWAPQVIVTSDAVRCVETVAATAVATRAPLLLRRELGEGHTEAAALTGLLEELVHVERRSLLCSHRPVLPDVFAALGVEDDLDLAPADVVVLHLRRGRVLGVERHAVTF